MGSMQVKLLRLCTLRPCRVVWYCGALDVLIRQIKARLLVGDLTHVELVLHIHDGDLAIVKLLIDWTSHLTMF